jgi:hypothetical protein
MISHCGDQIMRVVSEFDGWVVCRWVNDDNTLAFAMSYLLVIPVAVVGCIFGIALGLVVGLCWSVFNEGLLWWGVFDAYDPFKSINGFAKAGGLVGLVGSVLAFFLC